MSSVRWIDSASHLGALSARAPTIAVLGTGINMVYQGENPKLHERVIDNGTVITQFLFNRKGDKQSFTIRNGIVAGMTLGTGLFEADLTDHEQAELDVLDVTDVTDVTEQHVHH